MSSGAPIDWEDIIVHCAVSLRQTIQETEETLDLPSLRKLTKYWESCPPEHLLLKAFVGYTKPEQAKKETEASLETLMGEFPQRQFSPR